ncbi:MAG: hypothetical protein HW396_540 [Candidatus Dadabacteria bacterium]|nr:hypothetical protein [Candidatus Dadabacteria bacterium]
METLFSVIQFCSSIVSSMLSLLFGFANRQYQRFDYAVRLQVTDENRTFRTASFPVPFSYTTKVQNKGLKPVDIDRIYIDYGSKDDSNKRCRHNIQGRFYLSPGEYKEIKFNLSWSDLQSTKQQFEINQCVFFLRVVYHTPQGKAATAIRSLGGYDRDMTLYVVQRGDTLT